MRPLRGLKGSCMENVRKVAGVRLWERLTFPRL